MENKNKLQQIIKHIKTMFYNLIVYKVKTTYTYYYYLCFKDFFKKLLKPKKMIAVKWRIDPNCDFKCYTEITNDLFYHCSPIFYQGEYNRENNTYEFDIDNFDPTIRQDTIRYQPIESFRIVTNNNGVDYIITKNSQYLKVIKDCKINGIYENKNKIPFDRNGIINLNTKCILDYIENLFIVIEGNFEITDDISNLHKIEYDSFIKRFRIK